MCDIWGTRICMKGFHGRPYGIESKCKKAGNFKCVEQNYTLRCCFFRSCDSWF